MNFDTTFTNNHLLTYLLTFLSNNTQNLLKLTSKTYKCIKTRPFSMVAAATEFDSPNIFDLHIISGTLEYKQFVQNAVFSRDAVSCFAKLKEFEIFPSKFMLFDFDISVMRAASLGALECLKIIHKKGYTFTDAHIIAAAMANNTNALFTYNLSVNYHQFYASDYPPTDDIKSRDVIKFMAESSNLNINYNFHLINLPIMAGNVETVRYLLDIGCWPPFDAHKLSGSLEVTKLIFSQYPTIPASTVAANVSEAAELGAIGLLRYYHEIKGQELTDDIFYKALQSNNMHCIKYIIENKADLLQKNIHKSDLMDTVVRASDYTNMQARKMQSIEYLYSMGVRWDNTTVITCLDYKCDEYVIQFVIEKSDIIDISVLKIAAEYGNKRIMNYLCMTYNFTLDAELYKCIKYNKRAADYTLYYLIDHSIPIPDKIYYYVFTAVSKISRLKQHFEFLQKRGIPLTNAIVAKILDYDHPFYYYYEHKEKDDEAISIEIVSQYIQTLVIE